MNQTRSWLTCSPIIPSLLVWLREMNRRYMVYTSKWDGGHFLFSVILSEWDIAQYLRHRMQKDSRCQRIRKGGIKDMVAQDLEWTVGSLAVAGKSVCRLPNINSTLTQAESIMKCWRMFLLERKYILVFFCSCSQKHTHYSLWSYSQPCRFLFVHTNLLCSCLSFPATVSKKYQS